ncbi:uncharacterized protein [Ptychodera flava]|uniref:uncharacterized protein isoform X2 n=1 Tax=Ptychodera flava TaxID=63121 RepID=UPI003969DCF3
MHVIHDQSYEWIYAILLAYLIFQNAEARPKPNHEYPDIEYVCQDGVQTKFEGRCCLNCPPGAHMVRPCTVNDPDSTLCAPCGRNTFTAYRNLLKSCFPHHRCGKGQKTDKTGTATNNYKCSCQPGYVATPDGGCRPDRNSQTYTKRPLTSKGTFLERTRRLESSETKLTTVGMTEAKKFGDLEADDGGKSDKSEYRKTGNREDNPSHVHEGEGSISSGNNSVVIVTCFAIACVTVLAIVVVIVVYCKRDRVHTAHDTNPGGNDANSNETHSTTNGENGSFSTCDSIAGHSDRRNPGSGASASSVNLIDLDGPSQGSDAAFGINDTIKPTSQTSLNFLEVRHPGVPETGKAKSCTSLNDIRKNLPGHDNEQSQPSPDTPLLSSNTAATDENH